jgi:hypothetical protein
MLNVILATLCGVLLVDNLKQRRKVRNFWFIVQLLCT